MSERIWRMFTGACGMTTEFVTILCSPVDIFISHATLLLIKADSEPLPFSTREANFVIVLTTTPVRFSYVSVRA